MRWELERSRGDGDSIICSYYIFRAIAWLLFAVFSAGFFVCPVPYIAKEFCLGWKGDVDDLDKRKKGNNKEGEKKYA